MIKLSEIPTRAPKDWTKTTTKALTAQLTDRIGKLQHLLYAEGKRSVLVILQGMDGSGKDGAIRNVFGDCSPTGISVYAFKKPSDEEFAHDFLWRVHKQAPPKGMIQIFNRSHYEDILIQRVHKWIDEERVEQRMKAINAFEELLRFDSNTLVLKFYMHLSREQQQIELNERLHDTEKQWKFNANDLKEAELWDEYMRCYEYAINKSIIPWTIVPVDQRWYRDYVIAKKVVEEMEALDMKLPTLKP